MFIYIGDSCEVYISNKYLVTSIHIFGLVSNFIDITTIIVYRYGTNEIFKCFIKYIYT